MEPTQPPVDDCDCEPTEEEWRIAQSIPLHIPTAKCVNSNVVQSNNLTTDLVSLIVLIVHSIQNQRCTGGLKVLLDSGSNATLMYKRCLPLGAVPLLNKRTRTKTASGSFDSY